MPTRAPVSVCVISRDDPHLEQCLASVADYVAELCVVSTYSRDQLTAQIARKYGAQFVVEERCNDPQARITDFSRARSSSFALANMPWVLWIDSDDIVAGADKLVELCEAPRGTCYLLPYEYAYDQVGRVITRQYRERLVHGKDLMQWLYPVHEVLCAKETGAVQFLQSDLVSIRHQRQYLPKAQEPGRNLRILRVWAREHPDDVRTQYYYGLELANAGELDAAIEQLMNYLDRSGWPDERAMAYYQLARIHEGRREYGKALHAAFGSLETVDWFESYYAIARCFYAQRNWERCVHYGRIALSRPPTQTPLFLSDADRGDIRTLLTVAENALGNVEEAYEHCTKGLEANPKEPHLLHNRPLLARATQSSIRTAIAPGNVAGRTGAAESAQLTIVFATGPAIEPWDAETIRLKGNGGSETMLAQMARGLAARGHRVTVYAHPPHDGVHDDVQYRDVRTLRDLVCDVLVVSRYARLFDEEYRVEAKLRLLWCHDVVAFEPTHARLQRADKLLALSSWHRDAMVRVLGVSPDKVLVTRNGIDLSRFACVRARDPYRIINSSSPDRSWPVLLDEFPRIRAQVPEATLHLYYGLDGWKAVAARDDAQMSLIGRMERAVRLMPGVHYNGRVNQEQLAQAMLESTLWAHPTWFTETSCITAMEAKAAGLHIVTSNIGALTETARGGVLLDGEWTSPAYRNRFVEECVRALRSGPHGPWPDVDGFALDTLVADWERMFVTLLAQREQAQCPVLEPYEPTEPYRKTCDRRSLPVEGAPPGGVHEQPGTTLVKLNIACGPNIFPHPGWTNYDKEEFQEYFHHLRRAPLEGMTEHQRTLARYVRSLNARGDPLLRVHDMTQPFTQHPDNSVDAIYVGQAIEHLNPIYQAPQFLKECYRMLRPGGVLRMTTPDLRKILDASPEQFAEFAKDQPEWFRSACLDAQRSMLLFGSGGPQSTQANYEGHMMIYSELSMDAALSRAGFMKRRYFVRRGESESAVLAAEVRDEGLSHSMIVEAVK